VCHEQVQIAIKRSLSGREEGERCARSKDADLAGKQGLRPPIDAYSCIVADGLHSVPSQGDPSAASEEVAAWRLLDAVWDVPVGLGLCDSSLRFIRVNEALADFDGLSVAAHYDDGEVLARLPGAFAEGLRAAALREAHDVEFKSAGRSILVKLHPVLRPSDREPIGVGIVAVDVTQERKASRAVDGTRTGSSRR
jgi:PAS domain-containing protein